MKKQGREIIGFTMRHFDDSVPFKQNVHASTVKDAQKVCNMLDIEHFAIDLSAEFNDIVIRYFISEYQRGKTPNPCALCNPTIKWGLFIDKIKEKLQTDDIIFVTGHYARIIASKTNRKALCRAFDEKKDQSYMLWKLSQKQIDITLFPLSEISKDETRRIAQELGFNPAEKKDSQDICFIEGKYTDFLNHFVSFEQGDLIFEDLKVIGKHKGLPHYTLGQRKGLVSWEKPLYVKEIDYHNNAVIVTDDPDKLLKREFDITDINIYDFAEVASAEDGLTVQIRYNSSPKAIERIEFAKNEASITLKAPARSITPGQSAVIYDGDKLLGGGIIK
jgi:tRNA-specific 2-thiouridylase